MRIAAMLAIVMFPWLCFAQEQRRPLEAYWLSDTSLETSVMYDPLLVITTVSLEQLTELSKHQELSNALGQPEAGYLLDQPAIFLETYKRDSIWNQDGRPLKRFTGRLVKENDEQEMLAFGRRYKIASAEVTDVIRLLRHPEGTVGLHRLHSPTGRAERTIDAIALVLEDQLRRSSDNEREPKAKD